MMSHWGPWHTWTNSAAVWQIRHASEDDGRWKINLWPSSLCKCRPCKWKTEWTAKTMSVSLVTPSTQHCPSLLSVDHYCSSVWGTSLCQSNLLAKGALFSARTVAYAAAEADCIHPLTQHRLEESIETTQLSVLGNDRDVFFKIWSSDACLL